MRTHHRPSIPHRLGPLPSEFYTTVSTLTCRHTLPSKSIVCRAELDRRQNVGPYRRTSFQLRLGSLPSECYTTTSVKTHHRESIPLRLGALLSECYSMVSTYECSHTLHTRISYREHILTSYKISIMSSVRTHHRESIPQRLGPLLSDCYSTMSSSKCGYYPCEINIRRAILR